MCNYFSAKTCVVGTQKNCLDETILLGLNQWIKKYSVIPIQHSKLIFYFSIKTYVVGTQKNHLNEMVLLKSGNTFLPKDKEIIKFYAKKVCLSGHMIIVWARRQNTCLRSFRKSEIQTSLISYRDKPEN